jgi:hypothetical protein
VFTTCSRAPPTRDRLTTAAAATLERAVVPLVFLAVSEAAGLRAAAERFFLFRVVAPKTMLDVKQDITRKMRTGEVDRIAMPLFLKIVINNNELICFILLESIGHVNRFYLPTDTPEPVTRELPYCKLKHDHNQAAVHPPSIAIIAPFTKPASGDARYSAMFAISSGFPRRPIGCR